MPDPAAPEPSSPEPLSAERTRAERAGRIHRLDDAQVAALESVFLALTAAAPTATPAPAHAPALADVLASLADPEVAEGFLSEALTADPAELTALERFAEALLDEALLDEASQPPQQRGLRAAPLWLRARVLDRRGDVLAAEALLRDALAAEPTFTPALELSARYASDRGNAREAVALLRRAGVTEDDEYLVELERMIPKPRHDLGRNDPCWCGSGRKYKQCHLNRTALDLDERAYWLYRKAAEHVGDGPARSRMLDLATALRGEDELTAEAAWMALTDPIVADLVLIHDGAWDEFVTHRGPLLPDDERQLAERWATVPQTVLEVTEPPTHDAPMRVRDLRTGADHELRGFEQSGDTFAAGQRLLGRVVSTAVDGDPRAETLVGGLLFLDDALAHELLAALEADEDALTIAQIVGRHRREAAAAEPASGDGEPEGDQEGQTTDRGRRLVTTEGEPLVFCTTTYAIPAGRTDAVVAALDASPVLTRHEDDTDATPGAASDEAAVMAHLPGAFGAGAGAGAGAGSAEHRWREEVEAHGATWMRGTIAIDGAQLVLNTNAEARHERLTALLAEVAPDLRVIDETHRPAGDFPSG